MTAGKYDFILEQGTSVNFSMSILQSDGITPLSLTGYTFKGQIRKNNAGSLETSFTIIVTDVLAGKVQVSLTPTQSALLEDQFYFYDIIGTVGSDVTRFIEGKISVNRRITS